jgi:hypothetical protein
VNLFEDLKESPEEFRADLNSEYIESRGAWTKNEMHRIDIKSVSSIAVNDRHILDAGLSCRLSGTIHLTKLLLAKKGSVK